MKEEVRIFPETVIPLRIQLAGVSYCDGGYHIHRNCADVSVIEYVVKGEGYVSVDGNLTAVGKDTVYLLQAGTCHDYCSSSEEPWEKIFINAAGSLAVTLQRELGLSEQGVYSGEGMKDIFLQVEKIVRKIPEENDDVSLAGLFTEALLRLSRRKDSMGYSEDAVRMKNYLDSNTGRIVGNRELAEHIYRSKDYCIKRFTREYGVTPYDYQLSRKIDIACRLLRDSAMPVSVVAAAVGYHDPQYFSGLFRRKKGLSPREYRKRSGSV